MIDKIMDIENAFSTENRPNHVLVNEYLPGQGIMVNIRVLWDRVFQIPAYVENCKTGPSC